MHEIAEKYVEFASSRSTVSDGNVGNPTTNNENGFIWDVPSQEHSKEDETTNASAAANLDVGNARNS